MVQVAQPCLNENYLWVSACQWRQAFGDHDNRSYQNNWLDLRYWSQDCLWCEIFLNADLHKCFFFKMFPSTRSLSKLESSTFETRSIIDSLYCKGTQSEEVYSFLATTIHQDVTYTRRDYYHSTNLFFADIKCHSSKKYVWSRWLVFGIPLFEPTDHWSPSRTIQYGEW